MDMSGFESVEAIADVIEVQSLIRCDDRAYGCLDGALKLILLCKATLPHKSLPPSLLFHSLNHSTCCYLRTDLISTVFYNLLFHVARLIHSVWALLRIIASSLLLG